MSKISVVGAGRLGSLTAYHLMERRLCDELALVDVFREKAEGEAIDLRHCISSLGRTEIAGSDDYSITDGSDLVIVTAGIPRKPGETRLDLAKNNKKIMEAVLAGIGKHNKDHMLLIVSNPVDVMTYLAYKRAGLDEGKVFGLGTMLDTMRLKSELCINFNLKPEKLTAFVLGEHGDSMFPAYSLARYGGRRLSEAKGVTDAKLEEAFKKVKDSAMEVIKKKGATFYAPTLAVAEVAECIIKNQKKTLPLSTFQKEYGVCISVPVTAGGDGIAQADYNLTDDEKMKLEHSAGVLKKSIEEVGI
ncbi:MAG: malate dehydrogenase [Candidatus Altiarchaeota archaeon]